ncbi:hypothetical protein [Streptomyces sp. NPDC018031]|uniref:hypothetical protein n=1 Tax=Streptomyces sp. NPDC018031 TaxID=3365033 RepID=UPI0037A5AACD
MDTDDERPELLERLAEAVGPVPSHVIAEAQALFALIAPGQGAADPGAPDPDAGAPEPAAPPATR